VRSRFAGIPKQLVLGIGLSTRVAGVVTVLGFAVGAGLSGLSS
jgi:hypothetical protein